MNINKYKNLPFIEKLILAQNLWQDFANENNKISLPTDHKKVLKERYSKLMKGETNFKAWDKIKQKYS